MAIWNDSVDSEKCINCGANIYFDEDVQKLTCRFCGSVFDPETGKLEYQLEIKDKGEADAYDNRVEFTCDSCGAVVIASENTSATTCAFCGSPALIKGRLRNEFQPDSIIPFKVSRKEAEKLFTQWASSYKKAPKSFVSGGTVKNIKGVYVPFWLIDAECQIFFQDEYDYIYDYDLTLRKVPFDGSKNISDNLVRAIEPFDYTDLVPYRDGYLQGYLARRYDQSVVDSLVKINGRIEKYLHKAYEETMEGTIDSLVDGHSVKVNKLSQQYALLPLWILNYEYAGERYRYLINGQTGKVEGFEVPYGRLHYGKQYLSKCVKVALLSLLALAISSPLLHILGKTFLDSIKLSKESGDFAAAVNFFGMVILFALPILILYLLIKKLIVPSIKGQIDIPVYHIISDEPDVSEYLDTTSIKRTKRKKTK